MFSSSDFNLVISISFLASWCLKLLSGFASCIIAPEHPGSIFPVLDFGRLIFFSVDLLDDKALGILLDAVTPPDGYSV